MVTFCHTQGAVAVAGGIEAVVGFLGSFREGLTLSLGAEGIWEALRLSQGTEELPRRGWKWAARGECVLSGQTPIHRTSRHFRHICPVKHHFAGRLCPIHYFMQNGHSQDKFLAICFHGTAGRDSHYFAVRGESESISYTRCKKQAPGVFP